MERKEVFIIKYKRTPIGSFLSNLSSLSAEELASKLIDNLCQNINKEQIEKIYIGNVLSSGLGQNLARQIGYKNGINAPSITLNRVCGSGIQSIIEGYKSILVGENDLVLVGGTESMSNSPYLINKLRKGNKFGNTDLIDSMIIDGLTDPFSGDHMGELTEKVINNCNLTKIELDDYAKMSYNRARDAYKNNKFKDEIVNIEIKDRKNTIIISEDEEVNKINDLKKLDKLKPVFKKDGTITVGNSSKLSDGACLLLLASKEYIEKNNIKPIAKIIDYNLSVGNPEEFSLIPLKSIENILKKNNLNIGNIDYFELNEAFANVPIMVNKKLNISFDKINIFGGAISMGHPLGCSGARIVSTLMTILQDTKTNLGLASICNGGGGATSLLIQNLLK
jgi:acetyl-CoA C-acetyltransferase